MKKLSELIQENENQKQFTYTATLKVVGNVYSFDAGSAGELIDKQIDEISSIVEISDYNIDSVDEVENTNNIFENIVNEYGDDYADSKYREIMDMISDKVDNDPNLTDYYKAMIYTKLRNNI